MNRNSQPLPGLSQAPNDGTVGHTSAGGLRSLVQRLSLSHIESINACQPFTRQAARPRLDVRLATTLLHARPLDRARRAAQPSSCAALAALEADAPLSAH